MVEWNFNQKINKVEIRMKSTIRLFTILLICHITSILKIIVLQLLFFNASFIKYIKVCELYFLRIKIY